VPTFAPDLAHAGTLTFTDFDAGFNLSNSDATWPPSLSFDVTYLTQKCDVDKKK
jgi:hypothetical protein